MFVFSPLLEGERALAFIPKLPACYAGFLLLFDCVHKGFQRAQQDQK